MGSMSAIAVIFTASFAARFYGIMSDLVTVSSIVSPLILPVA
jgi:hypothetical protein